MQSSSIEKHRPLVYNNKVDMHSFVYGNKSQAFSVSVPQMAPKNYQHTITSLYDRYNRNNLYLKDCDERDIIILNKNIIIHEQAPSEQFIASIASKNSRNTKNGNGPPKQPQQSSGSPPFLNTAPLPTPQYLQNELFFNYNQMSKVKKQQKNSYLSSIQKIVQQAEEQLAQIQNIRQQQHQQIEEIYSIQKNNQAQTGKNWLSGQIMLRVTQNIPLDEGKEPLLHIHQEMNTNQINQILDDHHKVNEDIIERANRARSKSKELASREFQKNVGRSTQGQKLYQTMKKAIGPPKSMSSTMKDIPKPQRHKK